MVGAWPEPVERVSSFLRESGVEARIHEFPDGTASAQDAADAVGCELGQIVKSLVLRLRFAARRGTRPRRSARRSRQGRPRSRLERRQGREGAGSRGSDGVCAWRGRALPAPEDPNRAHGSGALPSRDRLGRRGLGSPHHGNQPDRAGSACARSADGRRCRPAVRFVDTKGELRTRCRRPRRSG